MISHQSSPTLKELQQWMRWILTDPRGVSDALGNPYPNDVIPLSRYTSPQVNILRWICEGSTGDQIKPLNIYAEAYFSRIVEVLSEDFPVTRRIVGEMFFQKLIADYLKYFPSSEYNISAVGKNLPRFVESYEDLTSSPVVHAAAKFDWVVLRAFNAPDTEGEIDLTAVPPESWLRLRFLLDASVYLLKGPWNFLQFWQLHREIIDVENCSLNSNSIESHFIIWRDHNDLVRIKEATFEEFHFLSCVEKQMQLGEILNSFSEEDQISAAAMTSFFNEWIKTGIIKKLLLTEAK